MAKPGETCKDIDLCVYRQRKRVGNLAAGLHREKSLEKETPPVLPGVFAYGKELENFVKLSMEGEPDER